jgi:hypothetical protein
VDTREGRRLVGRGHGYLGNDLTTVSPVAVVRICDSVVGRYSRRGVA